MIVEEIMKTELITLSKDHTIEDACRLMEEKRIRHLPITDENQLLVGLVTDRDIRDAMPSRYLCDSTPEILENSLESLMTTDLITCHPLDFVEEIAALFYEHSIGCLPIVNDRKLVGIVTETDLLHTLIALTGAHQPGSQIEVKVANKGGMLNSVASIISARKANISSVLVYPYQKDDRYKILVFRVQTMNPINIIEDLKKAGFHVLWPNMPGVSS
ncbi:acetoin utilization protein AcuB [Mesobacillus persicus]|uniref:Acetoin utilization protein AcuB n=1 Tax=Mesobacillus persicus TaxID=930146 RepID=A0A1H7XYT8_9BACI|nr:acetoin utilization AcuB family protein [Mesobacillus persicus]SEM38784.1 acetoin utilization protein AcuB [Mesobacillus persicus]